MTRSIQPVARALLLLQMLNQRPSSTLHQLHLSTGLPKPTVFRIVATLRNEGYVRVEDAKYALTNKVRSLSGGYTDSDRLVEVSIPITVRVTRETNWPLAIGTLEGTEVLVRHSTMQYSRLSTVRTTIEHRHDLLHSALGNVYLAYLTPATREAIVAALPDEGDAATMAALSHEIASSVSACGYGIRLPNQHRDTATIAVPILVNGELMAALSLTTFAALLDASSAASFLPLLSATANEIAEAYCRSTITDAGLLQSCAMPSVQGK